MHDTQGQGVGGPAPKTGIPRHLFEGLRLVVGAYIQLHLMIAVYKLPVCNHCYHCLPDLF